MKFLERKSPFDSLNPRLYHVNEEERYYITERHCFKQYIHPVESGVDMLLYCTLLCRTSSWTGDHHHRANPPFLNIGLIHSGETVIRSGDKFLVAETGDVFILCPHTDYELFTSHRCERSALIISGAILDTVLAATGLMDIPVFSLPDPNVLESYIDRMAVELKESSKHSARRQISNLCFEMIQFLSSPEKAKIYPEILDGILEKIGNEYMSPLSINDLAQHMKISNSSVTRLFRKFLHTTPYQYLKEIRMLQAAKMLEMHTLSIKEISERVGYNNPLNFSTEFKKHFGKSPKNFR